MFNLKKLVFFEQIIVGQGSKLRRLVRTTLMTQIMAASTPTRPRLLFPKKHTAAKRFVNTTHSFFKIYVFPWPQAEPAACHLTEWSAWSKIRGFCGLEKLKRNRACVGEGKGKCGDLDCGNAVYEETKVRTSIIDMMMDTLWVEFNFEFAPHDFEQTSAQNFSIFFGRYMIGQPRKMFFLCVPACPSLLLPQKSAFGKIYIWC